MTDSTDWQILIQKHLDGLTSEEEAAALSEQIVNNDTVRVDYLQAARLHGALGDETLELDRKIMPLHQSEAKKDRRALPVGWSRQLVAAIVTGAFVGLLGIGVVRAVNSPTSEASVISVADGSFESMSGPVPIGFPTQFGHWSGEPAEVIEEADGNHVLRFLETANVKGNPSGGASACNVFQLIDLTSLQQQWDTGNKKNRFTLELSAKFYREAAATDSEVPRIKGTCTIHLYDGEPESIGEGWPEVTRDAVAISNKIIRLEPGDDSSTITASCILESDATIALLSVNVNTMTASKTPIKLGGYFVDDVQLTAIKQPVLPVRFVK